MCELATIAAVASIAGTAMSAVGMVQQGQAAKAQANYQAAVMRNNQTLAEYAAQDAEARGAEAEQQHRQKVAAFKGSQRAALAANGLDLTSGSPLDLLSDTAMLGEQDALTIRANAQREAWSARAQGANFGAEAGLLQARGTAAQQAGYMGAGASLLSGASQVAGSWDSLFRSSSPKSYTAGVRGGYGRLVGGV